MSSLAGAGVRGMGPKKKLWLLEVTYVAYVLAEDEADAEGFADEVADTEPSPDIRVCRVYHHNRVMGGWEPDCLVYGATEDTMLGDVWPPDPAAGDGRQEHPQQLELLGDEP